MADSEEEQEKAQSKKKLKPRPVGEPLPAWIPRQRELFYEDWHRQRGLEPTPEDFSAEDEPEVVGVPPEQMSFRFAGHRRHR